MILNIYVSQIGLILDFIGAWLIYEYDLKETANRERQNRDFWKATGFVLIFVGFSLQFVEPWFDNQGILFRIPTSSSADMTFAL